MSPTLSPPPERPRRHFAVPRLSADPEKRSVQVGLLATILIHVLLILLLPKSLRNNLGGPLHPVQKSSPPQFNIELAPETFTAPKAPPPPIKFVETNPDAPDNVPDKTENFGAQNQQVAQEKPTPNGESDRPATEGEKDLNSSQIVTGRLSEPNKPHDSAPPVETPPVTANAAPAKREQNPLAGFEKIEGKDETAFGSNIAKFSENAEAVPEKVEGAPNAHDTQGTTSPAVQIDPKNPQPRKVLERNVRPGIIAENKVGTANIGPVAYDAKWSNYGQYLQKMIEAIQIRWEDFIRVSRHYPQSGTSVTVTFVMNSEGKIVRLRTVDGNAGDLASNWCVTAINPNEGFSYGVWTDDMIAVLGPNQELTFTFFYR